MKAAMNGVLNASILDGWWIEGFNGDNGYAIGDLMNEATVDATDDDDAGALYSVLESEIVPMYYDRPEGGLPSEWIRRMKNSIASLAPQFSSDRMVAEYVDRIYRQSN